MSVVFCIFFFFFFSSRRRHTRLVSDWSSDVCSSDLADRLTPGLDARGQPVRVPLGVAAAPGASDVAPPEPDLPGEHMLINLGPQHPATHGVLRLVVELDGETVVRVIPHLGYLHSGFEKLGEYRHY